MNRRGQRFARALERAGARAIGQREGHGASQRASAMTAYRAWCAHMAGEVENAVWKIMVELEYVSPMKLAARAGRVLAETVHGSLWQLLSTSAMDSTDVVRDHRFRTETSTATVEWTREWVKAHIDADARKRLGEGLRKGAREEEVMSAKIGLDALARLARGKDIDWDRLATYPAWLRRRGVRELDPSTACGPHAVEALIERDIECSMIGLGRGTLSPRALARAAEAAEGGHPITPPLEVWAALAHAGRDDIPASREWFAACVATKEALAGRRTPITPERVRAMVEARAQGIEGERDEAVRASAAAILDEATDGRVKPSDMKSVDEMWWRTQGWPQGHDAARLCEWEDGQYEGHAKGAWSLEVERPSRAIIAVGAPFARSVMHNVASHGPEPMAVGFTAMRAMARSAEMAEPGEMPRIRIGLNAGRRRGT